MSKKEQENQAFSLFFSLAGWYCLGRTQVRNNLLAPYNSDTGIVWRRKLTQNLPEAKTDFL